ncbi:hypothetical protein Pmani_018987 [Petrolisthes manimaculis]|uniref:Uncharacterized protein n=1 Tax=Petrolisthes manimaculis TaxID=1843537 RepID=A0AAE1PLD2_9EUCA|nr:hypothetical protein Pmani_018987 [Petrolisthes manimaculis]
MEVVVSPLPGFRKEAHTLIPSPLHPNIVFTGKLIQAVWTRSNTTIQGLLFSSLWSLLLFMVRTTTYVIAKHVDRVATTSDPSPQPPPLPHQIPVGNSRLGATPTK